MNAIQKHPSGLHLKLKTVFFVPLHISFFTFRQSLISKN